MKNKIQITIIALSFIIGSIGLTIAFYNNYIDNQTSIYASNYNVILRANWNDDWGDKEITIKNEGTTPVALRLTFTENWRKEIDNEDIIINNYYNDQNVVIKDWSNTFLNDFTYIDGWYYYNKILNNNDTISIIEGLHKSITYGSYNYNEYNYEINFYYETVQSTKNAIKSLWQINPNINNQNITWQ